MNLYVAAHCHHLEGPGMDKAKSRELLDTLLKHTTQDKYVTSVAWENDDDIIIWDNRYVIHRATGGGLKVGTFATCGGRRCTTIVRPPGD